MERKCTKCGMIITDDSQKRCPRCNEVLIKRPNCQDCKGCKIKNCSSGD